MVDLITFNQGTGKDSKYRDSLSEHGQSVKRQSAVEEQLLINNLIWGLPLPLALIKGGVFTKVSLCFLELVGLNQEDLVGRNLRILFENKKEYQRVNELLEAAALQEQVKNIKTRWIDTQNVVKDVELNASCLEPGKIEKGFCLTAREIQPSKRSFDLDAIQSEFTRNLSKCVDLAKAQNLFLKTCLKLPGIKNACLTWKAEENKESVFLQKGAKLSFSDLFFSKVQNALLKKNFLLERITDQGSQYFNSELYKEIQAQDIKNVSFFKVDVSKDNSLFLVISNGLHDYLENDYKKIIKTIFAQLSMCWAQVKLSEYLADSAYSVFEPEGKKNTQTQETKQANKTPVPSRESFLPQGPETFKGVMGALKRLQREKNCQKTQKIYQAALEKASDPIFLISSDGSLTYANEAACAFVGLSLENLRNIRIFDLDILLTEEEWPKFFKGVKSAGHLSFTTSFHRKQHHDLNVEISLDHVFSNTGHYALTVIKKIAESEPLKNAKSDKSLWQDALNLVPNLIQVRDSNGVLTYANKALSDFLKIPSEKLVGRLGSELWLSEQPFTEDKAEDYEILKSGVVKRKFERVKDLDDVVHTFETIKAPFDGQSKVLVSSWDISERKRLEKFLKQSQKMEAVGTLAGGIAHDFNNILTAILGYSELVADDLQEDHPAQISITQVIKAGTRARELVRQILSFSRRESLESSPVRISKIIKESLSLLRATVPTSIEITCQVEDENALVMADETKLQQVVMNLGANAAHAMRSHGGTLDVGLRKIELNKNDIRQKSLLESGSYLLLSFQDTGQGMSRKTMDHIFEPFFTTKGSQEGTGMGLAVVHGIVRSMAGDIKVESELGKGSTFYIFLPLHKGDVAKKGPEDSIYTQGGNERILFIDDEKSLVELGIKMLSRRGYKVTGLTSSNLAKKRFEEDPYAFDLVVTDQTMPEISGHELAKEMLKIRPDIPIILCTGFSSRISSKEAKALGAKRFVMKPIEVNQIARLIREVLDELPKA